MVAAACTGAPRVPGIEVSERDSAGVAIVEITGNVAELPEWALAEAPAAVIDGSQPPYFGRLGDVAWLSDGRVVAVDDQSVDLHLFAADGSYLRQLGDRGAGPGQYERITSMTVLPGDSVFAFDPRHERLSLVHPDAGFVRSIPVGSALGERSVEVLALAPDRLVSRQVRWTSVEERPMPYPNPQEALLVLTDGEPSALTGPVVFPDTYLGIMSRGAVVLPFAHRAIVAVGRGHLVHGSGQHYDVTIRDTELQPERVIRWTGWNAPIEEAELRAVRISVEEGLSGMSPAMAADLREAILDPVMLPEERPALGERAFVDELGRLWLSRFVPDVLRDAVEEWHLLSETGRPLARVGLPAGARLVGVREGSVLLKISDGLDVESLVVYELEG